MSYWDKNLPSRLLAALPKRSWLKRLRKLGHDVLGPLWRHSASMSAATRSRWQWTWVLDDSVFRKYGGTLELVGAWWPVLMVCSSWSSAAFRRRGLTLPAPLVVADSWFSDSKLMAHVADTHQGTFLVLGT